MTSSDAIRMARSSDSTTSHDAAEKKAPTVANDYAVMLSTLALSGRALTATELEMQCKTQGRAISVHKRAVECERRGLVVRCEPRRCSVTGYRAATWRTKP
jgi:hypothetical protein